MATTLATAAMTPATPKARPVCITVWDSPGIGWSISIVISAPDSGRNPDRFELHGKVTKVLACRLASAVDTLLGTVDQGVIARKTAAIVNGADCADMPD